MRYLVALAALCLSLSVHAQGVERVTRSHRGPILTVAVGGTVVAGNVWAQSEIGQTATIDKVYVAIGTTGGGGAANTTITFTDGTNTCTATVSCAGNVTNTPREIVPTGACTFQKGAIVTVTTPVSGCTSTQPSVRTVVATGLIYP